MHLRMFAAIAVALFVCRSVRGNEFERVNPFVLNAIDGARVSVESQQSRIYVFVS